MKSALEIAMEKTEGSTPNEEKLTASQKEEISELRKVFQGKVAEAEIMFQSELGKFHGAEGEGDVQVYLDDKREELGRSKRKLEEELEKKILEVKARR